MTHSPYAASGDGWTLHTLHRTPEAIKITPPLPLDGETWVHLRGDPPTSWWPCRPFWKGPVNTTLDQIDAYASKTK